MAIKTQKTLRNKQTVIKGNIGVPPWKGQRQMSLGGLNLVCECSTSVNHVTIKYRMRNTLSQKTYQITFVLTNEGKISIP